MPPGEHLDPPGRKLTWNAAKEEFVDDSEANSMLSRTQREPFGIHV